MVIHRLPQRRDGEISFRDMQAQLTEVGRIRIGIFNPDKGKKGAPDKLDRFRFTSQQEALIRAVAEQYGGEAREYQPQRSKRTEWEVISDTRMVPVYIEPQRIDPWLEAWRPGHCLRRCDGITETKQDVPCLCAAGEVDDDDICKPVARVRLMLAEVPGLGTWRLESHGEKFVEEIAGVAPYVAALPFRVPGLLYLEERRAQPYVKGRQISTTVFVPHLSISVATPKQFELGGDALIRALESGGVAPTLGAGAPRRELEAATPADSGPTDPADTQDPGLVAAAEAKGVGVQDVRAKILRNIEAQDTTGALDEIKAKLKDKGIRDEQIKQAWRARYDAIVAAAEVGGSAPGATSVTAGNGDHQKALRDIQREATRVVDAVVVDDRDGQGPPPDWAVEPEYRVGDTVTVGGIEFTKVAENPFEASSEAAAKFADTSTGVVYDLEAELNAVYMASGGQGWTTTQTNGAIKHACEIASMTALKPEHAQALHGLAAGIKAGTVKPA